MSNITKLLSTAAIATLLVACGGSSHKNKTENGKDGAKDGNTTVVPTTPVKVCNIKLVGTSNPSLKVGQTFKDEGATATLVKGNTDVTEKAVADKIVDTKKEGVTTITYTFPKTCGKESVKRTVTVKSPELTKENILGTI